MPCRLLTLYANGTVPRWVTKNKIASWTDVHFRTKANHNPTLVHLTLATTSA